MTQDYVLIGLNLLGALSLLIYGMKMMSEALQKIAGPQLRHVLACMTTNRLTSILTGTFVTCAVQSSSATTVLTVSFVSAGLLTLGQAISVIMGANIGTTLTAWIMSLGYNVDLTNVVFPAFVVGIILLYRRKHRFMGEFLFGIAFLFLSLAVLNTTGKAMDLAHNGAVVSFFASFDTGSYWTILAFLGIGTLITCLVESSAAVMALTIVLCSTGVIPIYLGIALVMGENIGTTATANLAALGANTQAKRAALAHLLFNVIGVVWVLCLFYPFVDMVCRVVGYDPASGGQAARLPVVLAMFHTCFNVFNTILLVGFVPQLERIACRLLPDKKQPTEKEPRLQYIQATLVQTPEISVLQAQQEIARFTRCVQQMFGMVGEMLEEQDEAEFASLYAKVAYQEEMTDRMEMEIAHYLEQVGNNHLSDMTKAKVRRMMREISELESIGDACYNMARTLNRRHESGQDFSLGLYDKLKAMMALTDEALTQMNVVIVGKGEEQDLWETYRIESAINQMCQQLKTANIRAVDDREYDYSIGTIYIDLVNECEKLGNYVVNVVQARLRG